MKLSLWELRYKIESHIQVSWIVALMVIAIVFGVFGFMKGKS